MKTATVVVLAGLISACSNMNASTPTSKLNQDQAAVTLQTLCCSTPAEIHYMDLDETNRANVMISHTSAVINFETGKSFTEGVKIPLSSSPIDLTIRSSIEHKTLFVPSVLILNDQFQAIDTIDGQSIKYQPTSLLNSAGYFGKVTLPARYLDGSRPAYIVLFTTDADASQSTSIEKPSDMAIQSGNIEANVAHNTDYKIAHARTGTVHVELSFEAVDNIQTHTERQQKVKNYVSTAAVTEFSEFEMYQNSVQVAVQEGYFSKALAYVEEAEKKEIQGIRETFIEAMKQYKE